MSDTIGIMGQKYEDRKSKKVGTLFDRDVENKKLSFLDEEANPFQVSFAAFKSNWRKVISVEPEEETVENETPANEVTEETVADAEPKAEPEVEPTFNDEDSKIKDFVKTLTEARVASVDIIADDTTVTVDDITVCTMHKVDGGYRVSMLPDIFIFAEWYNTFKVGDVHFNIKHGRHMGVMIDCVKASIGDILQFIKTAAVEINLYGYID